MKRLKKIVFKKPYAYIFYLLINWLMIMNGKILMNKNKLKQLRMQQGLSQQALVDCFYDNNIQISIATLKRAEVGKPVHYRIARAFACYFSLSIMELTINDKNNVPSLDTNLIPN